jgi:FtsP/CotA-like multicopper oxidase with cupredoxin domain
MGADVNLHFHGLGASPMRPSDDVLTMLAKPGQALHYIVKVPKNQPPGLYWYHTHVHGETNYQVGEGGMSGAIVVRGIAARIPALAKLHERVLMLRELGTGAGDAEPEPGRVINQHPCAPAGGNSVVTVNRQYRPTIRINPGQSQFFRVVNATGHRTFDLSLDGTPMQVVAIDGFPVDMVAGEPQTMTVSHVVVPPAARVEFIATGTAHGELRTNCYFAGPAGDPQPAQVLADLRPDKNDAPAGDLQQGETTDAGASAIDDPAGPRAATLPAPVAHRTVVFTENPRVRLFYINGKMYSPTAPPDFVVKTGTIERWTVFNRTYEIHAFHLHQVHFLIQSIDGVPVQHPVWRDTAVVPYQTRNSKGAITPGNIVMLADFRSPLIKGTFLFHCHILDHEDRGMMAKIQAI